MALITAATTYAMQYVESDEQSGLFFREISRTKVSYDSFTLIYHVNLEEFFKIRNKAVQCYTSMQKACVYEESLCDLILIDMERKLSRMTDFEENIGVYKPVKSRYRRNPILAVTALLSSMAFGIIDQVRMNRYESMLEELKVDYGLLRKIETNETKKHLVSWQI